MNRKTLGNAVLYSIGEIIPKALRILLLPIFTRFLTPEEYGIMAYTNSVVAFLFVVSLLSLNTFVIRFYFDFDPEDEVGRRKLIGNVFVFLLLWNLVLNGAMLLAAPLLLSHFEVSVPFYPYFLMTIGTNFFNVMSVVPLAVYRVKRLAGRFVVLGVSRAVFQTLLALVLVVGFDAGVMGVFWSSLIATGIYSVLYFVIIYRHGTFTLDFRQIRQGLAFSLPIVPATLSHLVIDMVDRVMLETYVALDRLGIYSVAYALGFGMTVIIQGGYRAFEPEVFNHFGKEGFARVHQKIKRYFLFVVLVFGTALALFAPEILRVMTAERFHEGDVVVPVVVLAACVRAASLLFTVVLVAAKKTSRLTAVIVTGAMLNILSNSVLIPEIGIMGAAWSTVISFGFIAPAAYWLCERYGLLRSRRPILRDLVGFGAVSLIVWSLVYQWRPEGFWLSMGIKTLVWFAVIAGLVWLYQLQDEARSILFRKRRR